MECSNKPIIIRLFSNNAITSCPEVRQDVISNKKDLENTEFDETPLLISSSKCQAMQILKFKYKNFDSEWNAHATRRYFVKNWKSRFPFLEYDHRKKVMFCKVCTLYSTAKQKRLSFVCGTKNFRLSTIQCHQSSSLHAKCMKLADKNTNTSDSSVTDKKNVLNVLKSIYFILKSKKPFTSFPQLCATQKKLLLEIGPAYTSHHKVVTSFSKFIAYFVEKEISEKIKNIELFSLVLDSSFSRGAESHKLVYITYVDNGKVMTIFLGIVQSKEVSGKDMFKNLTLLFERFKIQQWSQKTVFMMVDFVKSCPWLDELVFIVKSNLLHTFVDAVPILPHKIHQIIEMTKQSFPEREFQETISIVYQYYFSLSDEDKILINLNQQLDSISEEYGVMSKKFPVPFDLKTLEAVDKDWCLLIELLKQKNSSLCVKRNKSKPRILSSITKVSFILTLGLYLDVFRSLREFANNLEESDFLPFKIVNCLENLCDSLVNDCEGKGANFQRYLLELDLKSATFRNKSIQIDQDENSIGCSVKKHIEPLNLYFKNVVLSKLIFLKSTEIFDTENWRNRKVEEKVVQEFSDCFLPFNINNDNLYFVIKEWHVLREKTSSQYPTHPKEALLRLIHSYHEDFPVVTNILTKIVLLDFSSAEMRRGYREMNLVKSLDRSTLSVSSLHASMMIVMHGPPLSEFNPVPALKMWLSQCRRRYKKRSKLRTISTDECLETFL